MANANKTEVKYKAQFERTVRKTGKWRGYTPEQYAKRYGGRGFRSGHSIKQCDHLFAHGVCVKCKLSANAYYQEHPKKLAELEKLYASKKKKSKSLTYRQAKIMQ